MNTIQGNEEVQEQDFASLINAIKSGTLSIEEMKAVKLALKPKSETQVKREEAQASLQAFLDLPFEDLEYETVGDLYKDIQVLESEVKKFGRGGGGHVVKATKKWRWVNRIDRTNFKITVEGYEGEMSVSPEEDIKLSGWLAYFKENGFTAGQIAAVRKERPYRKNKGGVLSMDELLQLV